MIKKFFVLLFFSLTLSYAQSPEKFTYQSIIKNSTGYLLKNQDIGLKISVLFNSSNGIAVYSEEHTVESNDNGLVTLIIGEGTSSDVFSDIDWGGGEYFLKVEVDPEGGVNYIMEQTSQLLSVPYALYAGNANVNLSVTGQDYITISGNQINASKIDATSDVVGLSDVSTSGDYDDLINTPTLFDGDYANLTNTPQLNDGKIFVGDSSNKSSEVAVSGDVTITNAGVTAIGAEKVVNTMLADDAVSTDKITDANVTTAKLADDAVTTDKITDANVTEPKLADDAVTTAKLANITRGSILVGGADDAPTVYDAKTEGYILVGDGTDIASVAVSGDVTLAKDGAVTIADDAVTLTTKVAGVLPIANGGTGGSTASVALNSLGIKSGIHTWSASPSTSQTVTLSGVSSSSIIIVTMNGTGNNQFLKNVVPGSGEFIINMNGDPGDGTKFSYIVIIP